MKTTAGVLVALLFPVFSLFGQSAEQIQAEANPAYDNVVDQSPAAQLWRQIVSAKRQENGTLHASLVEQFKQRYPERLWSSSPVIDGPRALQQHSDPVTPGDWGSGDVRIDGSSVLAPTGIGSGRTIQLKADSAGNKYAAFIIGSGDTLKIYKSTDHGLTWSRLNRITPGGTLKWHSFDFFVTDSANVFKLGFAAVRTFGDYAGDIFWMHLNDDGTGFRAVQVQPRPAERGLINPAIMSDGFVKSAATTYWYMVYQNCDSASGTTNAAVTALSMDWGQTWLPDTARSSFNDYDLDIDYTDNGDSLHVLLTNDLTATNPNLRLRRISLANYALGTWLQYNPATTSAPEDRGCLVINRQTNDMLVTYTLTQGSNKDIAYSYRVAGVWTNGAIVSAQTNDEDRARADCEERQGAYRLCFVSTGGAYDTVVYSSSTSPASGFAGHTVVNLQASASNSIYPDVAGYRTSASGFGGGVAFAGPGSSGAYYDGSNISTSVHPDGASHPGEFLLEQNYPNPFNPSTTIRFSIPVRNHVRLVVCDLLGREVAEVVSREMDRGSYAATVDASGLASGTYFYRLQSGDFVRTKKFIVLR